MKNLFASVIFVVLMLSLSPAQAQISVEDLPSMGNLGKLIGELDLSAPEQDVYDENGNISSGMPVIDSARGEATSAIASLLSDGNEEAQARIEDAIEQERVAFDNALTQANFEIKDLGVGFAVSFLILWELASDREIPVESSLIAGESLVQAFAADTTAFDAMPVEDRARLYDFLMATPVAFASLVKGFENEGMNEEAKVMREQGADLFTELFKVSPEFFTVSDTGELGIDADQIEAYQIQNGLSDDW